MKLDVNALRYLSSDDFRVLTAIELGMRNHELVPVPLIDRIAGLSHGGAKRCITNLAKAKLLHHESKKYDGYRLNNMGYDYLALKTFAKRGHIYAFGRQIGVGKESDIYIVVSDQDEENCLKIHRLGRTSFRSIKKNRDYLRNRHTSSWLYLSRLSALKEYAFMVALHEAGFPTPKPIDCNRHCVLMSRIKGKVLYNVHELSDPHRVFKDCVEIVVRLAQYGLIHGDFNEFNIMITDDDEQVVMIDFPQMVSTSHLNAEMYFNRDIEGLCTFFEKRFKIECVYRPNLADIKREFDLDVQVAASGFTKNLEQEYQALYKAHQDDEDDDDDNDDDTNDNDNIKEESDSEFDASDSDGSNDNDNYNDNDANKDNEANKKNVSTTKSSSTKSVVETAADESKLPPSSSSSSGNNKQQEGEGEEEEEEEEVDSEEEEEKARAKEIVNRVRKNINKKNNREFNKHAKRNATKGRDKRKLKNECKAGPDAFF